MVRDGIARVLVGVMVVLAAAAQAGCQGGLATDGVARSTRAALRNDPSGARDQSAADDRGEDADAPDGALQDASDDASGPAIDALVQSLGPRSLDLDSLQDLPDHLQQLVESAPSPSLDADPNAPAAVAPAIDDVWPNKGLATGGEAVAIRGKGLQAFSVQFGFAPAAILDVKEAEGIVTLTVAAPPARAGAGQVKIVVRNRDGGYAIGGDSFLYYN